MHDGEEERIRGWMKGLGLEVAVAILASPKGPRDGVIEAVIKRGTVCLMPFIPVNLVPQVGVVCLLPARP